MLKSFFKIIKNISIYDLTELFRYYQNASVDILFYSSHPIDETWIKSTKKACKVHKLSYATIRNIAYKDTYETCTEDCYYSGKNGALFFFTKVFVTASTGLYRRVMPLGCSKRVHMPHSLVSLHMIYPKGAFDNFNILFCSGKHHQEEFYALHSAQNVSTYKIGYGKMDLLQEAYKHHQSSLSTKQHILIAPSWAQENLIDSLALRLVPELLRLNYKVTIRPHPMFFIQKKPILNTLEVQHAHECFTLENPLDEDNAIFNADLIISDYSGIAFEYIYLREKPALFVNVAKKVLNKEYQDLGLEPIEVSLRNQLGLICDMDIKSITKGITHLLTHQQTYKSQIINLRKEYLYNNFDCATPAVHTLQTLVKES